MGFFSGVTNAIGSVFKAGTKAAANWGQNAMMGGGGGGKGALPGSQSAKNPTGMSLITQRYTL